jgi:predicted DNA-binding transcriptional regulator YafY
MNRIDRLLGIITTLQTKKYVSAESIAAKYSISIRTVYRDIKAIGEQGIPVSFEPNRGYFVVQGFFLPPVSFNSNEANALLLMQTVVERFADKSIQKHYASALDKVKSVMRLAQKEQLEELQNHIRLQTAFPGLNDFEYLSLIQEAIGARTILDIHYKKINEEISRRRVEPIGLVFYAYNWHLAAWCHQRREYRDFRVSRMLKVINTHQPFSKTKHIDLNEFMKQLPVTY